MAKRQWQEKQELEIKREQTDKQSMQKDGWERSNVKYR